MQQPVDTGFIVHNLITYPNLIGMFAHLEVDTEDSNMSFAVSAREGALEYAGGRGLRGLLAQRRNIGRPLFWGMISDIVRFNRLASADLNLPENVSLAVWLSDKGFGRTFLHDHLLPMTAAIWSATTHTMLDFPAAALFRFLHSHGLLQIADRPQWRTVSGGCRTYVDAVIRDFKGAVYKSCPVTSIHRHDSGVSVHSDTRGKQDYDAVVMATHANTTLSLLADPSERESELLGAFGFAANTAVLHRDPRFMPKRRAAWASWNYLVPSDTETSGGTVTYWMNLLQNISSPDNLFVTLDPPTEPRDILASFDYEHPQFDEAAIRAQKELPDIQGERNTWFCGAWCGYGFHEDGLAASIRVANDLGADVPWGEPE